MKLKPLGDHLAVELIKNEPLTASGIILPETAVEKSSEAIVLAVGPGVSSDFAVGDRVLCSKYAGTEIQLSNARTITILSESDILAIVESEELHD